MRDSVHPSISRRWLLALFTIVLLLSMASGVWASPSERGLRQTVPTRTPMPPPPTDTPVPPTVTPVPPTLTPVPPTPTPEPPTATPEPKKKDEPKQPTAEPTQVIEPTPTPEVVATATLIASAGYPESGADYTPLLVVGLGLLLATCSGVYVLRRRRLISGQ